MSCSDSLKKAQKKYDEKRPKITIRLSPEDIDIIDKFANYGESRGRTVARIFKLGLLQIK